MSEVSPVTTFCLLICLCGFILVDDFSPFTLGHPLYPLPCRESRPVFFLLLFFPAITQSDMDGLASFLGSASWKKDKENPNVLFCDDAGLEPLLAKASNELPDYLQRHGFQVWKVLEETKFVEKDGIGKQGYIIPVMIISGHPRLLSEPSQPLLVPNTPTTFQREPVISPALYLILALPPAST